VSGPTNIGNLLLGGLLVLGVLAAAGWWFIAAVIGVGLGRKAETIWNLGKEPKAVAEARVDGTVSR